MVSRDELERRIRSALPDAEIVISDLTGGGDHYAVEVISKAFAGVSTVMRHRMVYAPLRDILGGPLHALQLATRTPEEQE
jgi:stress-induced morphogen